MDVPIFKSRHYHRKSTLKVINSDSKILGNRPFLMQHSKLTWAWNRHQITSYTPQLLGCIIMRDTPRYAIDTSMTEMWLSFSHSSSSSDIWSRCSIFVISLEYRQRWRRDRTSSSPDIDYIDTTKHIYTFATYMHWHLPKSVAYINLLTYSLTYLHTYTQVSLTAILQANLG